MVICCRFSILVLIMVWLVMFPGISSSETNPLSPPDLVSGLKIEGSVDFCGETVPFQNPEVRERYEREMLISLWQRHQVILWLKRAGRYFPVIEALLKQHNMPDDLKYVAVAESALRPHAGSSKGAVGYWQFIRPTALRYGLRVDNHFDDRRNIYHATRGAIRYFKKLHDQFGHWALAAAAYNAGEGRVKTAVLEQQTSDFYRLHLPLETQRYLLRIVAVKRIMENPERYGFHLSPEEVYPKVIFDNVSFDLTRPAPVGLIARSAGTYVKMIKDLNPELRGYELPKGRHKLMVQKGAKGEFQSRLTAEMGKLKNGKTKRTYVVRKGDNLSNISRRFDIPLTALLRWNGLSLKQAIHPGDRIIVSQE